MDSYSINAVELCVVYNVTTKPLNRVYRMKLRGQKRSDVSLCYFVPLKLYSSFYDFFSDGDWTPIRRVALLGLPRTV